MNSQVHKAFPHTVLHGLWLNCPPPSFPFPLLPSLLPFHPTRALYSALKTFRRPCPWSRRNSQASQQSGGGLARQVSFHLETGELRFREGEQLPKVCSNQQQDLSLLAVFPVRFFPPRKDAYNKINHMYVWVFSLILFTLKIRNGTEWTDEDDYNFCDFLFKF